MALVDVTLPELGEDAGDKAKVSFWYVEPGERVAAGDNLVQMLTDKATFDVPCPQDGTIKEHKAGEDDEVHVGEVICTLETGD
jgi:pyruvate/2-oxoglutarate dehydrogenase complex dihydrolipoamide acyltransferase (E2) component